MYNYFRFNTSSLAAVETVKVLSKRATYELMPEVLLVSINPLCTDSYHNDHHTFVEDFPKVPRLLNLEHILVLQA